MSAEEIRQELEAAVRRRVTDYLDQIREEFERLRIESRQRWEEMSYRFDFALPELVPAELVPEPAPPPAPPAADLSEFRRAAAGIDGSTSQVDTLRSFLAACAAQADRVVLLVLKGEVLSVWKSEGFDAEAESGLRSVSVAPDEEAAIARAMTGQPLDLPAGSGVSRLLRAGDARAAVLVPVAVRERVSALLYADRSAEDSRFDPEAIALLCFLAGLAIDRLAARKLVPSPALRPFEPAPESAPAAAPVEAEVEEAVEEPEAVEEVEEEEAAPPPAVPPPPPKRADLDSTSQAYRPPPGVVPGGAAILRGPLSEDQEEPHERARRIARILVADIRLYNEASIEEGRIHNDIYERLREDIDRARQVYNERVPEAVREGTNYFHEELVRSLAGGDPEALGL
jgi:hypothetical protein